MKKKIIIIFTIIFIPASLAANILTLYDSSLISGYFKYWSIAEVALPILFVLVSLLLWYKYGNDDPIADIVCSYPPEGYNSTEIAYLYKAKVQSEDIISLLVYLANKGYIKIINSNNIIKVKEYNDHNDAEKLFMQGLFVNNKKSVLIENLNEKSLSFLDFIEESFNTKENKEKIIEKSSSAQISTIIMMISASYLIINLKMIIFSGILIFILFTIITGILAFILFYFTKWILEKSSVIIKVISLFLGLLFSSIPLYMFIVFIATNNYINYAAYISGFLSIIVMGVLIKYIPRRTFYGSEVLGKIQGFKTFIENADIPALKYLIEQDPSYFYNVLSYTYTLDISDKFIEKFSTISLPPPIWYETDTSFNANTIKDFMESLESALYNDSEE